MEKIFQEMAKVMDKKFTRRRKKYGDSWKTDSILTLERGLEAEFKEFKDARTSEEIQDELVDIAIYCNILYKRIEESKCSCHCRHYISAESCNKSPDRVPGGIGFCNEFEGH